MSAPVMTDQFFDQGWKRSQNTDTSKPKRRVPQKAKPVTRRRHTRVVKQNRECRSTEKTRKGWPPAPRNGIFGSYMPEQTPEL